MRGPELRIPTTDELDWQMKAACRGANSELFYHPDGERGIARTNRVKRAKEFCRTCDVLMQCRSYALKTAEPFGTWGGMSETERGLLLGKNRRQRTKEKLLAESALAGLEV